VASRPRAPENDSDAALAAVEEKFADFDPFDIADVHAFRGEIDQAFTWLDRAIHQRKRVIDVRPTGGVS
jgi:hypothetical protein